MGNKPKGKKGRRPAPRPATGQPEAKGAPWLKYSAFGVGIVGLIVLLAFAFQGLGPTEEPDGIVDYPGLSREHTSGTVVYEQDPPVGGPHAESPFWQNCGFYDTPVRNENAVHSLEHGAVWITYDPGLEAEHIEALRDLAQQSKVLVTPYPGLGDDAVASVWGRQLRVSEFDKGTLESFIITQKDGATTPEPGAVCFGGVGQPVG